MKSIKRICIIGLFVFLTVVSVMFLILNFAGTDREQNENVFEQNRSVFNENDQGIDENNSETEFAASEMPQQNDIPEIEICREEKSVEMNWNGEHLSKAVACVGEKIYLSQWEREDRSSCLYEMEIGENAWIKSPLEVPETMDIQAMHGDGARHLHMLLRNVSQTTDSSGKQARMIREYDEAGNQVKELDVEDALNGRYILCQAFFTDSEGNYYIKDMDYMICLDQEGKPVWEIDNRSAGINKSYAAASTEKGIYMTYQRDDKTYLALIDPEDGTPQQEYLLTGIGSQDMILAMKQGRGEKLLLYGAGSGIWTWDCEENLLTNRFEGAESNLPYHETVIARCFLSDGRFLLIKNISEKDQLTGTVFHYIPAEE